MNTSAFAADTAGSAVPCPQCQHTITVAHPHAALPAAAVLVSPARAESHFLRLDLESLIALSAFALIVVAAVLFYARFHH